MAVRYDRNFMSEITKVINQYNRKITRLSKLDNDYQLPQKFTRVAFKNLKATATSRVEVRRRLKDLESFTARGGEKLINIGNATLPKYQYDNIKRYRRLAARTLNRKLKKYKTTKPVSSGKKSKLTFAELGEDEYLNLLAKKEDLLDNTNFNDITSNKEYEKYLHKLRVNIRDYDLVAWQKNYIDIFQDTALSYGYDPDKLDTIVWALQKLNPEQFDELAFEDRNIKEVLTHYKALLDISSAEAFAKSSEKVIDNLDAIYDNLEGILAKIKSNG